MDFWQSLTLLLIGVAAGAGPTLLVEHRRARAQVRLEHMRRIEDLYPRFLRAASLVRHRLRLLSTITGRPIPRIDRLMLSEFDDPAERQAVMDVLDTFDAYWQAYDELSLHAPSATMQAVRALRAATFELQRSVERGDMPGDKIFDASLDEAIRAWRSCRAAMRGDLGTAETIDTGDAES